jgi:hypothetical protein
MGVVRYIMVGAVKNKYTIKNTVGIYVSVLRDLQEKCGVYIYRLIKYLFN